MALEDWLVARARVSARRHKKVNLDDRMAFFQQLATLVSSGTPLLQAIQICAQQTQSGELARVLDEIAARVAAGRALYASAASYTDIFQAHWIDVIRTGETAGKMGPVLVDLVQQIRESRETRRRVAAALVYPAILIAVSLVAITILLWLVVPTFATMFRDIGAELPGITRVVVNASDFVVHYGLFALLGVIALVVAVRQHLKSEAGQRRMAAISIATPMVGELIVQSAMYRFASHIALLLRAGVPMLESLSNLESVFQANPIYRDAIRRVHGRVAAGQSLADSLEDTGLFTTMMTSMVRIGEESAELPSVMEQVAPYYREKMEGLIAKATKLMEPVIIVGMGGAIALVMIAIYLPMFDMAGNVH